MTRSLRFLAVAFAAAAPSAWAATTQVSVDDRPGDFLRGELTTATLSHEGVLERPPHRAKLVEVDAEIVWDALRTRRGILMATGHEGKLFELRDGEARELATLEEPASYALLERADGTVLVAASPSGTIYRLDGAELEPFAETGQRFLWRMIDDPERGIVAATGPEGMLLSVRDDGTTTTIAKLDGVANIMDLRREANGDLLLGTQGRGRVVVVAKDNEVSVLLDVEEEEVRRVASSPDGSVYAAVNGQRAPGESYLGKNDDPKRPRDAKARDASFIIRLHPDGFSEEFWTSPFAPIHDMALLGDGSLLVSAGDKGALMRVGADGRASLLSMSERKIAVRLVPDGAERFLVATANKAGLEELDLSRRVDAEYLSRVFNTKTAAVWGRLHPVLAPLGGGRVTISTRTGNTPAPDSGWSAWSRPAAVEGRTVLAPSAPARFFQYRAQLLEGDGGEPRLDAMRVFYTESNQQPTIVSLEVAAEPAPKAEGGRPPAGGAANSAARSGPLDTARGAQTSILNLKWTASDPNGDRLLFTIEAQEAGSDRWILLEEGITANTAKVDTAGMPDGMHRFRLTVSDELSNARGTERRFQYIGDYFTVDQTAPELVRLEAEPLSGSRRRVSARAIDSSSVLTSAWWRADAGEWRPLLPIDGIFDDYAESFDWVLLDAESAPGTVVTVFATDDAGNTAVRSLRLE
ncbi:MAG: hypothetical protein SF028_02615 [Candidatus Sumerlaeia bacterium]|nr:hypothetical protein [Candidatus Sumerlaeia bacterium]